MKLQVFLDTNVIPRKLNHLDAAFESMCWYVKNGLLDIHLSEVVYEEWLTQRNDDVLLPARKSYKDIERMLKGLGRLDGPGKSVADSIIVKLSSLKNDTDKFINRSINDVINRLNPKIHQIKGKHSKPVFQAYFSQGDPFSSKKNRQDIPDAFIYQCALELLKTFKTMTLHCIVHDKNLRNSLNKVNNIRVYKTLHEFIRSKIVVEAISKFKIEQNWKKQFPLIESKISTFHTYLERNLYDSLLEPTSYQEVSHSGIPSDDESGLMVGIYEPYSTEFNWDGIENFSTGIVILPFEVKLETDLEFVVFRGDSSFVPQGVWVHYGDYEEDHYFEAGGTINVMVEGTVFLKFDIENVNKGEMPILDHIGIDEIKNIEVIEDSDGGIFQVTEDHDQT